MAKKPTAKGPSGAPRPAYRVRKNMDIDALKLREAREVLGARSETETVDRALDLVVFQHHVLSAIDDLAAAGGVEDIYAPAAAPQRRARVAERKPAR